LGDCHDNPLATWIAFAYRPYTRSIEDHEVLEIARAEDRILITNDKDFGELIYRQQLEHTGVILFRLRDEL